MKEGEIVLLRVPQVGGRPAKLRPALVLCLLPGTYQSVLVCGISTQTSQLNANWEELLDSSNPEFAATGLHRTSAARLSYLYAADAAEIAGTIGNVSTAVLMRLRGRLAARLS
jgi:hypothetical protein